MRKLDIIREVSKQTGMPLKEIKLVVDAFLYSLKKAILNGDRVEIRGFGVFLTKKRKKRKGRNLKYNVPIEIPERNAIVFKPSIKIKEKLVKREV